ncbi:MAG: NlpC/P60 family protein, partial [Actinomycetota bacterium]|nr:NlpC/P60 family protein [Actinomycetota bacterium]
AAQEASRSAPRPAPAAVSGSAAVAVDFAMAQLGDAYAYGAAGPDAWDCSGLTMGAWGAAGVSLPHSSSGQMSSGTPVSSSDLQPGDLVFYYDPVSHVGIYVGNGQIVHASNPSDPVNMAPVFSMPYSGAVRPG